MTVLQLFCVVCCFQDLYKTTCIILRYFPLAFILSFVRVQVVHPCSSTDTATALKKSHFILLEKSGFYIINNLSIAVHIYPVNMLISLSADEVLLLRYINWSTNFRGLPLKVEMAPCLKHMNFVLSLFP